MNNLIHKFMQEAGTDASGKWMSIDHCDKFAELIIRETIKQMAIQMDKFGDDQSNNPDWYKSEEAVKKHFGVDE